jgi:hypothetical protein
MNEYVIEFTDPLPPLNFRTIMQSCGARKIHVHVNRAQIFALPEDHHMIIDTLMEFVDARLVKGFLTR